MSDLQDLEELWLGCNQLENASMLSLPKLHTICLSSNRLSSAEGIQNCPLLLECLLDNNKLASVEALSQCKHVEVVDISSNSITDLEPLCCLPLTDLWMSNNHQLDVVPEVLKLIHKDKLQTISAQGCKCPGREALIKILCGQFVNLTTINGDVIKT